MKEITIQRIFNKTTGGSPSYVKSVQIHREEDNSLYHAWKILSDSGKTYLLKRAETSAEEDFYKHASNNTDAIADYFGGTEYYNKRYFIIEFFDGQTLSNCNRPALEHALDALCKLQESYWQKDQSSNQSIEKSRIVPECITINKALEGIRNRRPYLLDQLLEKTFDLYIDLYEETARTLCHDDLLPFNVLASEDRAILIDWEYYGILPYPISFARFIAHTRPDPEWDFVMSEEDKAYAIDYYYNHLIKRHGISYKDYRRTLDLFLFYEMTEWIYLCRKYNVKHPERFNYSMESAMKLTKSILDIQ
ncbi:MAG: phosphotransferase [Firmicutes bacterium]|nr:phosphotransferase [Bacillota bacterium]